MHHRSRLIPRVGVAATVLVATTALSGCGSKLEVVAAPSASAPACATALAAAPATVLDHARISLDTPGALAWGEPAMVLRCGLPELGPTTLQCISVNDVDWVVDTESSPMTAATYGRAPAVELAVPTSYGPPTLAAALVDVAPVAKALPTTGHPCT